MVVFGLLGVMWAVCHLYVSFCLWFLESEENARVKRNIMFLMKNLNILFYHNVPKVLLISIILFLCQ